MADDGKSQYYTYCIIDYTLGCIDDGGDKAITRYNQNAKGRGVECSLFASGTQIVWDGPIFYEGSRSDYLFTYVNEDSGRKRIYAGWGDKVGDGRKIAIRAGQCRGEADLDAKKWFIKGCKNDYSARGTFVAGEGIINYYGIGRSNKDNSVKIQLFNPSSHPRISKASDSTSNPISTSRNFGEHPTIPNSVSEKSIAKYNIIEPGISPSGKPTRKAFVATDGGSYGYASNRSTIYDAVVGAFRGCKKHSSSCRLYDLDGSALEGLEEKEAYKLAKLEDLKARPDKELCNLATNPEEKLLKWDEVYAKEFVEEAKRRKLTVNDCNKYLDIIKATPEKPSSPSASRKTNKPKNTLEGFGRTDCTLEELLKSECDKRPPTVKTPQPQGSGSVEERLSKLKELLGKGLLTPDEGAAKRKEILKGL